MGNKFRKFQIMFTIVLVIGFSIPILSFLGEYIANPSIYQNRKENMKLEYDKVEPPMNAKKIKETINSKVTRIWIGTDYTVEMKKEDIEKYYQEELLKKGWKYEKTAHDGTISFTKNDFLFEVAIENNKIHTGLHYRGSGSDFANF
jgi:hypothetical protein